MTPVAANTSLLRAATEYEVAAALMHHQPAAAFRSLFVMFGYGSDLIDRVSLAELSSLEARLEARSDERRYVIDQLRLVTLEQHRPIELAGVWPQFYCFAHCSIRQFPVFFALREAAQCPALEAQLVRIVGQSTVRYQDWRLENAYEWALISAAALQGQLQPEAGFALDAAVTWRLIRPITEMGGRSPVLEWHLMKRLERDRVDALPLMTVITDAQGQMLRKVDQHVLQAFRARGETGLRVEANVSVAPDREPLVRVSLQGVAIRPEIDDKTQAISAATPGLELKLAAATTGSNVVPLYRAAG